MKRKGDSGVDTSLREWLMPKNECHLMFLVGAMRLIDGATAEEGALIQWAEEHYAEALATYREHDVNHKHWHEPTEACPLFTPRPR